MNPAPNEVVRVSTLELFFDLVFVFTITQLTTVLVHEPSGRGLARVVLILGVIWWMYGGYAWMTNSLVLDRATRRFGLLAGMAAFLLLALTIPRAFEEEGAAFGTAYLVVVAIHAWLFTRAGGSAVQAMKALAPYNFATALLVLAGGIVGGDAQYVLWALAFLGEWGTPRLHEPSDFSIAPAHFVERHALVLIVALGESVVAIGIGAAGLDVDAQLTAVVVLALALSASLWWLFFGGDDEAAERALAAASPRRRAVMAIDAFGYSQLAMLLGIIVFAAGTKKAVAHPFEALHASGSLLLGGGVALFVGAEVLFRRSLGIEPRGIRTAAAAGAFAMVPLGLVAGAAEVGALVLVVGGALAIEARAGAASRPAARSPSA